MFTVKCEKNILCASMLAEDNHRTTATLEMGSEFAARTVSNWINNAEHPEILVDIGFHISQWASGAETGLRKMCMCNLVGDIMRERFKELGPRDI